MLELLEAFAQLREPRVAEALEVVALGWIDVVARYEFVNRDAGQQVFRKIFGKVSAVAFFVAVVDLETADGGELYGHHGSGNQQPDGCFATVKPDGGDNAGGGEHTSTGDQNHRCRDLPGTHLQDTGHSRGDNAGNSDTGQRQGQHAQLAAVAADQQLVVHTQQDRYRSDQWQQHLRVTGRNDPEKIEQRVDDSSQILA